MGITYYDPAYPIGTEPIITLMVLQQKYREFLAQIEDDCDIIYVCPQCKTNEYFNTEWGLWCPLCDRYLQENELIIDKEG